MKLMRERVIEYNGIKVLDIKKGYYVHFINEVLHLGKAKEKYLKAFVEEIKRDEGYYREELSSLYGEETMQLVFDNLSEDKLPSVDKQLQGMMQKRVMKGYRWKNIWLRLLLLQRL